MQQSAFDKLQEFRRTLPTFQVKDDLVSIILDEKHPVTIIASATGSGKSTQIPQYLYEILKKTEEFKRITVTQPRRVAAISLASRVAKETGSKLGELVGYNVRFDEKESKETKIRFVTDGIAVRESLQNQGFEKDSVFIVDEAHERSINTDVVLGLLKQRLLRGNKNFRVVIMSATINTQLFANYFQTDKVLYVQGRMYPVRHRFVGQPERSYVEAAVFSTVQVCNNEKPGDILVFLPGEREILQAKFSLELLLEQKQFDAEILTLYGNMQQDEQMRVFDVNTAGKRRILLATNIAETSLTIPNIIYIIDSGLVRCKVFDPKKNIQQLLTIPASQASVNQRSGRAGRVACGIVFHLYTFADYQKLKMEEIPEILRCDLSDIFLVLIGCDVKRVLDFNFLNQPSILQKKLALQKLMKLGLIVPADDSGEFKLTDLGKQIVMLPLQIEESVCIVTALNKFPNFVGSVIDLISVINSLENFYVSADQDQHQQRLSYHHAKSDHASLLMQFQAFEKAENRRQFASKLGLQYQTLNYIMKVRNQIAEIIRFRFQKFDQTRVDLSQENIKVIVQILQSGYLENVAVLSVDKRSYETRGSVCRIHPSSSVKKCEKLLYQELVQTTDIFLRCVSVIE